MVANRNSISARDTASVRERKSISFDTSDSRNRKETSLDQDRIISCSPYELLYSHFRLGCSRWNSKFLQSWVWKEMPCKKALQWGNDRFGRFPCCRRTFVSRGRSLVSSNFDPEVSIAYVHAIYSTEPWGPDHMAIWKRHVTLLSFHVTKGRSRIKWAEGVGYVLLSSFRSSFTLFVGLEVLSWTKRQVIYRSSVEGPAAETYYAGK